VSETSKKTQSILESFTRRRFLQYSALTGAALFLIGAADVPPASAQKPKYSILVDVSKCIGCRRCVAACQAYHKEYFGWPAEGTVYTKVSVIDNSFTVPQLCLHCVNAPCAEACITHAITQLEYGPVTYDRDKCIGCLLCVSQCPFQSITYHPNEKRIYKCDMCYKRIEKGMVPNCVGVCPPKTRSFGLYDDKVAEGVKLAEQKNGILLYQGDTSTLYVLTQKQFERLVNSADATAVKNEYPADSRWVADILKYSRYSWIPVALGTAFYVNKWLRASPKGTS
jgi:Fe-S-cluster-containing dehydrogenase component